MADDLNHFDHFFIRKNKTFKQPRVKKSIRNVDEVKPIEKAKEPDQPKPKPTEPVKPVKHVATAGELEAEEQRNFVKWVMNGTLVDLPKVNHHLNLPGAPLC